MIQNPTNKKLAGLLLALTIFYVGLKLFGNGNNRSSSFKEQIVDIDTSNISKINIGGNSDNIEFHRNNNSWKITLASGKQVSAMNTRVQSMLSSLQRISPSSIATNDPNKWRDYQVDSTGKRVEVFEGDSKTLDLVIGRSSTQGQRSFLTYVRLSEEDNVYAIDNFSGSSISDNAARYRDQNILKITPDSLVQIRFSYPGEDDFTLINRDTLWQMDGSIAVDSAKTADFLKGLDRISSKNFADDITPASLGSPSATVVLQSSNKKDITIEKYDKMGIVHSSINPENYFSDTAVINKIFVTKSTLISIPEN